MNDVNDNINDMLSEEELKELEDELECMDHTDDLDDSDSLLDSDIIIYSDDKILLDDNEEDGIDNLEEVTIEDESIVVEKNADKRIALSYDDITWLKIPKEVIEDVSIGKYRVPLFCYLQTKAGMDGTILLNLKELVSSLGMFYTRNNRGGNRKQMIDILVNLKIRGYISELPYNLDKISALTMFTIRVNVNTFFPREGRYGFITYGEYKKIRSIDYKLLGNAYRQLKGHGNRQAKIKVYSVLTILAYIRVNTYHRSGIGMSIRLLPECCSKLLGTISESLKIHIGTVSDVIKLLSDIGIIYCMIIPKNKYMNSQGKKCFKTDVMLLSDRTRYRVDASTNSYQIDETYNGKLEMELQKARIVKHLFIRAGEKKDAVFNINTVD